MLWRGQHGDVLDTFVVGLAGFLDAAVPGIAGRGGVGRHACILVEGVGGGGGKGGVIKKPAGLRERRRLLRGACYRLCTRSSSAGKRDKEPEIKRAEHLHGRQCSTA